MRPLRNLPWPQGDRRQGSLTLGARIACVFPGQGSQRVGMGAELAAAYPCARRVFAEADEVLGTSLSRLCFEGPETTLALTENAQAAILTTSIATFRALEEHRGFQPEVLAGHSLGEWSALVAGGVLRFADAVRGVRERGRFMQSAVPVGAGAMAAVLGMEADAVGALCQEVAGGQVLTPANLNGAGQVVVAGDLAAVERLVALVAARGGRAQRLNVSAPFHCALMAPAAAGLEGFLADIPVDDPRTTVLSSVDARPLARADVKARLVEQITAPVRWEETARAVAARAPTLVLEVGPGRTLTGLMKRIAPGLVTLATGDREGFGRAVEALG